MNFNSFSHGQITAKLWLCQHLEPLIPKNANVVILGSWHNVLGFIMQCRRPDAYQSITGIDVDPGAKPIADAIMDTWCYDPNNSSVFNRTSNVNYEKFQDVDTVYINTSTEHFEDIHWFDNLPKGALVAIQSTDVTDTSDPWYITQPTPTFEDFLQKYPLELVFHGILPTHYNHFGYNRFMAIGYK
jgi:hypothetical protein